MRICRRACVTCSSSPTAWHASAWALGSDSVEEAVSGVDGRRMLLLVRGRRRICPARTHQKVPHGVAVRIEKGRQLVNGPLDQSNGPVLVVRVQHALGGAKKRFGPGGEENMREGVKVGWGWGWGRPRRGDGRLAGRGVHEKSQRRGHRNGPRHCVSPL